MRKVKVHELFKAPETVRKEATHQNRDITQILATEWNPQETSKFKDQTGLL